MNVPAIGCFWHANMANKHASRQVDLLSGHSLQSKVSVNSHWCSDCCLYWRVRSILSPVDIVTLTGIAFIINGPYKTSVIKV